MMKNNHCLIACTGAFGTHGGIASANRLMIDCLAQKFNLDILVLNEEKQPKYSLPKTDNQISYSVYKKNKKNFTLALWQAIQKRKYLHIFFDHVNLAWVLAPFSRLGLLKYYVWLYGFEVYYPKPTFEGLVGMKAASKCLAISNYTAEHVGSRFPSLNIRVCQLSLSNRWHTLNQSKSPQKASMYLHNVAGCRKALGAFVILHVGQMNMNMRNKGQDILVSAFPRIVNEIPKAQLVLVGEGDSLEMIIDIATQLPENIQQGIFITGYLSDEKLSELYDQCFLFAMPSLGEGFGLVYLEAFDHSKPCVGSRLEAVPEVIEDGKNGLLVNNPRSKEEVSEKIIWMLENPGQARRMGEEGKKMVNSNYLFPHFTDRFWKSIG
jgi:phosphatidyl-myo-inositol dimannoside synthase